MIYFSLAVLLPMLWYGYWWLIIPVAFVTGYLTRLRGARAFAIGSGLAWATLAFFRDGELAGRVSKRMAGMFSMPSSGFLFLLIAVLGFVTAWLWFKAGRAVRTALRD